VPSHDAFPPEHVRVLLMRHRWERITFLHWSYDVDVVAQHLPRGLTVEPWEGKAWVGLVPFRMVVRPPAGPGSVTFPETNVRTYVTGPDGRPGVFFFSLDAASMTAVSAARATWRLPYHLATMSVAEHEGELRYLCSRRAPSAARPQHDIRVRPGQTLHPTEFDHYLTARFTLWNSVAGMVMRTAAEHPPWDLQHATVEHLEQDLIQAAGLPAPEGDPLVHYSDGVAVRIGAPRRASSASQPAATGSG
jgi:uncharacterized protein